MQKNGVLNPQAPARRCKKMKTDAEALALIQNAFGTIVRPEHFTDHTCCEECQEHDQLLLERDNGTLSIEDVGNICWQPISYCSGEGFAYYMPALARLALSPPTYAYGWYGETLEILLSFSLGKNRLHTYCTSEQRLAISEFLVYLGETRCQLLGPGEERQRFVELARRWAEEC